MFLDRDEDPSKDGVEAEFPRCSLPELYALVENFNKESKKLNHLKTHSISPSEAQKMLGQNLNAMSFTSGADLKEDPQAVFTCKVVRKDEEALTSMTELLHRSLLTSVHSLADRLSKSQQRLAQRGIPPLSHTFPYEIFINNAHSVGTARKKMQSTRKLSRPGIFHIKPGKFFLDNRTPEYLLVEPGTLNR